MTSSQELATRKLLLQQRSAVLRHVLALQVNQTLAPAMRVADQLQSGALAARSPSPGGGCRRRVAGVAAPDDPEHGGARLVALANLAALDSNQKS